MATPLPYRPRIVLVDDHPQVLRGLSRLLGPGCEIVAGVTSGQEALEVAASLTPDVVIVDLTLADIDGLEICRRLKKSLPETDVIILTAFDDERVEVAAMEAGASAFVVKHAAARTLHEVIQGVVETRRSGS